MQKQKKPTLTENQKVKLKKLLTPIVEAMVYKTADDTIAMKLIYDLQQIIIRVKKFHKTSKPEFWEMHGDTFLNTLEDKCDELIRVANSGIQP